MVFPVSIRTPHLYVRELTQNDLMRFLQMSADPDVIRYMTFSSTSEPEARALIDFALASANASIRTEYVLAVEDGTLGYLIGSCGLSISKNEPMTVEAYFVFRKDVWGRGYGVEVLQALIDFAFDLLCLTRVFGQAHPENYHSIVTMERAGMAYDGVGDNPHANAGETSDGVRFTILNRR